MSGKNVICWGGGGGGGGGGKKGNNYVPTTREERAKGGLGGKVVGWCVLLISTSSPTGQKKYRGGFN